MHPDPFHPPAQVTAVSYYAGQDTTLGDKRT